jgi:hypothetical protein
MASRWLITDILLGMGESICSNAINYSMLTRIILTIISLVLLFKQKNNIFIGKHLYLILPILLTLLDETDNIHTYSLKYRGKENGCTKTFDYQIKDKIIDVLSYFFSFSLFGDSNVLLLSIYRAIGVILFYFTRASYWLILFFDFVKEYMLYIYLFKDNCTYLPIAIIGKILFEYYFHTKHNKREY